MILVESRVPKLSTNDGRNRKIVPGSFCQGQSSFSAFSVALALLLHPTWAERVEAQKL